MARFDIKTLEDDIIIDVNTGDWSLEDSDQAHLEHIVTWSKGDLKEFPLIGVGIDKYLKSVGTKQRVTRLIIENVASDAYGNIRVLYEDEDIYVDATPKN
jgi:hypothetical protein